MSCNSTAALTTRFQRTSRAYHFFDNMVDAHCVTRRRGFHRTVQWLLRFIGSGLGYTWLKKKEYVCQPCCRENDKEPSTEQHPRQQSHFASHSSVQARVPPYRWVQGYSGRQICQETALSVLGRRLFSSDLPWLTPTW